MFRIPSILTVILLAAHAHADLPPAATGKLYVSDYVNDRVAVYAADGTFLQTFATPGLNGPRGIVFAPDGTFYVASQLNSVIYHFDAESSLLGQFSSPQLSSPTGMAISPGGELHVSSFSLGRICVFGLDGSFDRFYTAPGFTTPNCVAFDSAGNIYAASAGNGTLFKWDANESFLMQIDTPPGVDLISPMGIARDHDDNLYVAGGSSHNIVKFATDGSFLGEISHVDLTGPQGVAFDDRGHIWSSSFYQDVIVEFDAAGDYVQTITAGNLRIPRSIAFDPGRPANEFPSLCNGDGGDGAGCTSCPCANDAPAGSVGGCLHSAGVGAQLHVFGSASLASADLRMELTSGPPSSFAVLTSGDALAPQNPANPCFGTQSGVQSLVLDGLRCAVTNVRRHGARAIDANGNVGATLAGWGEPDGFVQQDGWTPGTTRHYQVVVRDLVSAQCGTGQNTSQARSVTFVP